MAYTSNPQAARMDGARSTLAVLKYVLDQGVDAGAVNASGHSLLHKAAIYGRADVCAYLLEGRWHEEGGGEEEDAQLRHTTPAAAEPGAPLLGGGGGPSAVLCSSRGGAAAAARRPPASGWPLGRAHVLPDLRRQTPSEMARYNGFFELAAYLRHHEDLFWHAPVVWRAPSTEATEALSKC
jgi:ankyrin repeat protein